MLTWSSKEEKEEDLQQHRNVTDLMSSELSEMNLKMTSSPFRYVCICIMHIWMFVCVYMYIYTDMGMLIVTSLSFF